MATCSLARTDAALPPPGHPPWLHKVSPSPHSNLTGPHLFDTLYWFTLNTDPTTLATSPIEYHKEIASTAGLSGTPCIAVITLSPLSPPAYATLIPGPPEACMWPLIQLECVVLLSIALVVAACIRWKENPGRCSHATLTYQVSLADTSTIQIRRFMHRDEVVRCFSLTSRACPRRTEEAFPSSVPIRFHSGKFES